MVNWNSYDVTCKNKSAIFTAFFGLCCNFRDSCLENYCPSIASIPDFQMSEYSPVISDYLHLTGQLQNERASSYPFSERLQNRCRLFVLKNDGNYRKSDKCNCNRHLQTGPGTFYVSLFFFCGFFCSLKQLYCVENYYTMKHF